MMNCEVSLSNSTVNRCNNQIRVGLQLIQSRSVCADHMPQANAHTCFDILLTFHRMASAI